MRNVLGILLALAALATLAAPAQASNTQISVFQDDRLLVLGDPATRERALDDLALLGVDTIHSIVFWNKVAPAPNATKRPAGFDGADPAAYAPELWDRYDAMIRGASARGIDVILSPSSPLPLWASGCKGSSKVRRTCRPNPTQYKRFVEALGKRYSGDYADENQGQGLLPRVSRWSVYNEPNLASWLSPQFTKRNGRTVPVAPALYRALVRGAIKALAATAHGSDDILFGETAPLGGRAGGAKSAPGDFLRNVLCIDRAGRALRGAVGKALDCQGGFSRLGVTGVAHHPYTRGGTEPPTRKGKSSEITISSASRLKTLIDQAARRGRIPGRLPIFYTEFGFQTDPPDPIFGRDPELVAQWINQADWIAFNDKRVSSVAQYELRDEPSKDSFNTGLRFVDGTAKPSLAAYRVPIWVVKRGGNVRVWGQIRPAEDDAVETVEIQNDPEGDGTFVTVSTAETTNRKGYISVTAPRTPGTWRLRWSPKDGGPAITSRVAKVASR